MNKLSLWYPVKPWIISQPFGVNGEWYRKNGIDIANHNGIDIPCDDGQGVYASHEGTVVQAGYDNKGGLGVTVQSNNKYEYKGKEVYFKTLYWHLKSGTVKVKVGQKVGAGTLLAGADNTGFSTGTHLHFGLKPVIAGKKYGEWYNVEQDNGYGGAIDPKPYFNNFYSQDNTVVMKTLNSLLDLYKQLAKIK